MDFINKYWEDDSNNNYEEINESNSGPFDFNPYSINFMFLGTPKLLSTLTGETANTTIDSSAPLSSIAKIII